MQRSAADVNGFRACGFASIISKCDVKGKIYKRKETLSWLIKVLQMLETFQRMISFYDYSGHIFVVWAIISPAYNKIVPIKVIAEIWQHGRLGCSDVQYGRKAVG